MTDMLTLRQGVIAAALLLASLSAGSGAQAAITEEEAHAIGVDAYLYFYSLGHHGHDPQAAHQSSRAWRHRRPDEQLRQRSEFPSADMSVVVRPNFDTLYSSAWLDLTKEPMVVSVPDTDGRYYLLPMLDMWTDVFASPGWRTTGNAGRQFPGRAARMAAGSARSLHRGIQAADSTQRIDAPTPYVWIIGRTKTDGPADYDAVHKIQAGYKITPLSQWGKAPVPPEVKIDPTIDMKTPPKMQVDTMPAGKYFAYAAELLKLHPPHITDQPIIARLEAHRLRARQELRRRQGRSGRPEGARERAGGGAEADGVESSDARQGRQRLVDEHRHHGRLRQLLSQARHRRAARPRREPAGGRDLSAQSRRRRPASRSTAPTTTRSISTRARCRRSNAFWSITLYDARRLPGRECAQPLRRLELDAVQIQSDGSLDLYFQNESPGADKEANWLPAPKGPFNLTMRLYAPKSGRADRQMEPAAGDEGAGGAHQRTVAA